MWPFKKKVEESPEPVNVGKATVVLILDNGDRMNVDWTGNAAAHAFDRAQSWCADCAELGFFHFFEDDGAITWLAVRRVAELRITWRAHFITPAEDES